LLFRFAVTAHVVEKIRQLQGENVVLRSSLTCQLQQGQGCRPVLHPLAHPGQPRQDLQILGAIPARPVYQAGDDRAVDAGVEATGAGGRVDVALVIVFQLWVGEEHSAIHR
jgi:hypothetical protein